MIREERIHCVYRARGVRATKMLAVLLPRRLSPIFPLIPAPPAPYLSVAGFDNTPMSGNGLFSLTTVHQPVFEMAERSARILLDSMTSGAPPAPMIPAREGQSRLTWYRSPACNAGTADPACSRHRRRGKSPGKPRSSDRSGGYRPSPRSARTSRPAIVRRFPDTTDRAPNNARCCGAPNVPRTP